MAGGHVAHLVEKGEVVVGDDVAGDARVPVPVPRAADVAPPFDDADRLDAYLPQPGRSEQRGEPAADEEHLDLVVDGIPLDDLLDVRIGRVACEVACEIGRELRRPFRAVCQTQVPFLGEPALDLLVVLLWML